MRVSRKLGAMAAAPFLLEGKLLKLADGFGSAASAGVAWEQVADRQAHQK